MIASRLAHKRGTVGRLASGLLSVAGALVFQAALWAGTAQAASAPAEPGPRHARPLSAANRMVMPAEDPEQARVIVKYHADSAMRRALGVTAGGEGTAGAAGAANRGALGMTAPLHATRMALAVRAPLQDGRVLGAHTQSLKGLGLSSSELARRLRALPEVEWAVVDERRRLLNVPNDPLFGEGQRNTTPASGQWYLRAPDSTIVSAINAVGAWTITTGSPDVTVAVLDTGVRRDHEDLQGKLLAGYDFVGTERNGSTTTANDGDGRDADPSDPGDWTNANECASGEPASSSSWHGTQVAGLIGASTNNGIGMAGAGWQVKVLPVRVLGRCGGYDSDIIAAMRWAAGVSQNVGQGTVVNVPNPTPARVINMSLGSAGACSPAYQDVVDELTAAGVTTVVAAGNDTGLKVSTPANCKGAIAVAGIRHLGSKVGYSNIGPEVALAAPAGNCVNLNGTCLYPLLTTVNLGLKQPGANGYTNGEDFTVGTSFASPLVAATAALMISVDPSLTPAKVREILVGTTRAFPTSRTLAAGEEPVPVCRAPDTVDQLECFCTTTTCGSGMLDASAAVARALAQRPAPTPVTPVTPTPSGGGSGGGTSGLGWLLGLLLATGVLHALKGRSRSR